MFGRGTIRSLPQAPLSGEERRSASTLDPKARRLTSDPTSHCEDICPHASEGVTSHWVRFAQSALRVRASPSSEGLTSHFVLASRFAFLAETSSSPGHSSCRRTAADVDGSTAASEADVTAAPGETVEAGLTASNPYPSVASCGGCHHPDAPNRNHGRVYGTWGWPRRTRQWKQEQPVAPHDVQPHAMGPGRAQEMAADEHMCNSKISCI
jgi:hypothetical protein